MSEQQPEDVVANENIDEPEDVEVFEEEPITEDLEEISIVI